MYYVSGSHDYSVLLPLYAGANKKQEGGRGFLPICKAEGFRCATLQ